MEEDDLDEARSSIKSSDSEDDWNDRDDDSALSDQ